MRFPPPASRRSPHHTRPPRSPTIPAARSQLVPHGGKRGHREGSNGPTARWTHAWVRPPPHRRATPRRPTPPAAPPPTGSSSESIHRLEHGPAAPRHRGDRRRARALGDLAHKWSLLVAAGNIASRSMRATPRAAQLRCGRNQPKFEPRTRHRLRERRDSHRHHAHTALLHAADALPGDRERQRQRGLRDRGGEHLRVPHGRHAVRSMGLHGQAAAAAQPSLLAQGPAGRPQPGERGRARGLRRRAPRAARGRRPDLPGHAVGRHQHQPRLAAHHDGERPPPPRRRARHPLRRLAGDRRRGAVPQPGAAVARRRARPRRDPQRGDEQSGPARLHVRAAPRVDRGVRPRPRPSAAVGPTSTTHCPRASASRSTGCRRSSTPPRSPPACGTWPGGSHHTMVVERGGRGRARRSGPHGRHGLPARGQAPARPLRADATDACCSSAALDGDIEKISRRYMHDPVRHEEAGADPDGDHAERLLNAWSVERPDPDRPGGAHRLAHPPSKRTLPHQNTAQTGSPPSWHPRCRSGRNPRKLRAEPA